MTCHTDNEHLHSGCSRSVSHMCHAQDHMAPRSNQWEWLLSKKNTDSFSLWRVTRSQANNGTSEPVTRRLNYESWIHNSRLTFLTQFTPEFTELTPSHPGHFCIQLSQPISSHSSSVPPSTLHSSSSSPHFSTHDPPCHLMPTLLHHSCFQVPPTAATHSSTHCTAVLSFP